MSLIQQVTPQLLEVQSVLPDRELNTLYRYVAFMNGGTRLYVMQWQKTSFETGWCFIDEQGTGICGTAISIRNAINDAIACGFTVYRISNSSI